MKNFLRSISAAAFGALLIAGASVPTDAIAANFDGSWSVVINTLRGDCGSSLRYGVRIVGGRVMSGGGNYAVAGQRLRTAGRQQWQRRVAHVGR